jgi:ABC-2 type transport system permease protein
MVRREFWQLKGQPVQLVSTVAFPAALMLVFSYVFGSAIKVPGENYQAYLMPGLFVMTATYALLSNSMVISMEMSKGVIDRFRSMPMARLAVPFGQTGADAITGVLSLLVVVACGLAVGWSPHDGLARTIAALALVIFFRYAMSWVGVYLGLIAPDDRTAQNFAPLLYPLTMITNIFVPVGTMPAWLRDLAYWNPVSAITAACRQLFGNPEATAPAWPLQHPVVASLAWSAGLIALFAALAVRRYVRASR